jgi:translocation and assembly module TamA
MIRGRFRRAARLALIVLLALPAGALPAMALDQVRMVVTGGDDELERSLRNASILLRDDERTADSQELLAAAQAEYGRLLGVLYAAGHYSGVIRVSIDGRDSASFSPLEVPQRIREIVVTVNPGPRFTFGRAEIGPLARNTELPEEFAPGQIARSTVIRDATRAAVLRWRAVGHARAQPGEARIVAVHPEARLDAQVPIVQGPRVTFGELQVRGNERTPTYRVRKIAGFPSGETFDPEQLERAAQRLRRTGTFASVAISEAEDLGPDNTLDITVTLIEAPLRRFGFGAELDSDDGLRLSAFWLHRNLLGGAEQLRVEGEVGGIGSDVAGRDYRFALRFSRPATLTPDTTLRLTLTAESISERFYDSERLFASVGLAHIFSDRITGDVALGYLFERTDESGVRTDRSVLALPMSLRYDSRDDDRDARRGNFVELGLTPFLGLTNTDNGAQITADARRYQSVGDRVVLAGRLQLGAVPGASIDGTPREFLFLSGGGGTVRGQPYRSLGVACPSGPPDCITGGRGFGGIQAEARVGITGNIGAVGFVDAARVSPSASLSGGDWHAGAGLGVRYNTAIGPLRVDLAGPVGGDTGRGLQLYIGIGQAF